MIILILSLIVGTALVYISKFNFQPTTLNLGFTIFTGIPLFYIIVGSLVIGLVLSYAISVIQSISTTYALHRKNEEIKRKKEEVLELTKRIHQLEIKNERLIKNSDTAPQDSDAL